MKAQPRIQTMSTPSIRCKPPSNQVPLPPKTTMAPVSTTVRSSAGSSKTWSVVVPPNNSRAMNPFRIGKLMRLQGKVMRNRTMRCDLRASFSTRMTSTMPQQSLLRRYLGKNPKFPQKTSPSEGLTRVPITGASSVSAKDTRRPQKSWQTTRKSRVIRATRTM